MFVNKKKTLFRALEKRLMLDASITAIGGNVLWLDAADQTTVIDNDGDSVGSGGFNGQVAQWNDKSGNGNNVSNTLGVRQPTYTAAGLNGNDLISFDGGDGLFITDALQTGLDLSGNGMTLIAVTNPTSATGERIIINKESSYEVAFRTGIYQAAIETTAGGSWNWAGSSAVSNAWHVTGFTFDDTVWNFHQESAITDQRAPANSQTGNIQTSNNAFNVGARGSAGATGSFFQGDMAEVILFDRALTNDERLDVEIYLSNKWGIALNNATPVVSSVTGEVAQGGNITIDTSMLYSVDGDSTESELIYEVTSLASNGTLRLSGVDLNVNDTFTQQDIIDGNLTFLHDGSVTAGSFDFTVNDRITTTAVNSFNFTFNVAEISNNTLNLNEGGSVNLYTADLSFSNPDSWYDINWQYRQKVTIDSSNIGANLTDFTVLLTQDNMSAGFWADVKADGSDIVFTSSDGSTKLSRELVDIDTVLQTMELHVKVPNIGSVSDTDFYIYYGNGAGVEVNDVTAWNADYAGVWHFDEGAGNAIDATVNGNDGTVVGGAAQGVVGNIGNAISLDGNNDVINVAINKGASTTFSFWSTWVGGAGAEMAFVAGNVGSGPDVFFSSGVVSWNTWNGSANAFSAIPASANDGNFHHYEFVIDPSGAEFYFDGVLAGTAAYADPSGTTVLNIGGTTSFYWGGVMDEFRVNNTAVSADWVAAEYANQSNPSTFYSLGGVETGITPLTYTLNALTSNGVMALSGVALGVNDTFTQDDLDAGLITYAHDDSNTSADLFSFSVSDGFGSVTGSRDFNFSITLVDDDSSGFIAPDVGESSGLGASLPSVDSNDGSGAERNEVRTYELIRSSLLGGDGFYGDNISEVIRDGTVVEVQSNLSEMNGDSNDQEQQSLPEGTPQIVSSLSGDAHDIWQILDVDEAGTDTENSIEQIDGALLMERNKFDSRVIGFLEDIGGGA